MPFVKPLGNALVRILWEMPSLKNGHLSKMVISKKSDLKKKMATAGTAGTALQKP
jgi:hypothetical protein